MTAVRATHDSIDLACSRAAQTAVVGRAASVERPPAPVRRRPISWPSTRPSLERKSSLPTMATVQWDAGAPTDRQVVRHAQPHKSSWPTMATVQWDTGDAPQHNRSGVGPFITREAVKIDVEVPPTDCERHAEEVVLSRRKRNDQRIVDWQGTRLQRTVSK